MAWRSTVVRNDPSDPFHTWRNTRGSLTRRLQQGSQSFRVERIRQGLEIPLIDEWPLGRRPLAWVRDVVLHRDARPVVFAHSVLAHRPPHALDRLFRGLHNRALGSLLFTDPRFRRLSLEFRRIDSRHPLFKRMAQAVDLSGQTSPHSLWARRARFAWQGKTLLVTEVFLPAVLG